MSDQNRNDAMKALAAEIANVTGSYQEFAHPLDINWDLAPLYLKAAAGVAKDLRLGEEIPRLCTMAAASPFDAAIHDAFGKAHRLSCYRTYGPDFMARDLSAYLGPEFRHDEIAAWLVESDLPFAEERDPEALCDLVAEELAGGATVGWFQGRMEFGPRALGGRSILADPRDPKMRDTLNVKIKFREGFRPFAPSVLEDKAAEWFDIDCASPYMLLVAQVREGKRVIPSVTHVDNSARLQTVSREQNALYYDLIAAFEKITGVPIIINTSFNVRGEPIVCTPNDAYLCFMRTNMDALVMGSFLLDKKEQPPLREDVDWRSQYELD